MINGASILQGAKWPVIENVYIVKIFHVFLKSLSPFFREKRISFLPHYQPVLAG